MPEPVKGPPEEVAIHQNYWTISIHDLDVILDRITVRADTFGSQYPNYGARMREAGAIVRALRDELLAANYEANRKGKAVMV